MELSDIAELLAVWQWSCALTGLVMLHLIYRGYLHSWEPKAAPAGRHRLADGTPALTDDTIRGFRPEDAVPTPASHARRGVTIGAGAAAYAQLAVMRRDRALQAAGDSARKIAKRLTTRPDPRPVRPNKTVGSPDA